MTLTRNLTEQEHKELNNAIYTVITTQYKKDAKEAHDLVTAYGYSVSKYDGRFRVISKSTGKAVYVCFQSYICRRFSLGYNTADQERNMRSSVEYKPCRIDFVNFLEKPFNKTWYDMTSYYPRHSRAVSKFREIKDVKWDIKYYGDKMNELKGQIARLEDEMISYSRRQVIAEENLRRKKREYHLA